MTVRTQSQFSTGAKYQDRPAWRDLLKIPHFILLLPWRICVWCGLEIMRRRKLKGNL